MNYRRADQKSICSHIWNSLRKMTATSKRTCHLIHSILETHRPHTNGKSSRYIKCLEDYPNGDAVQEWDEALYTQYVEGRTYLDEQLSWYNNHGVG